MTTASTLDTSVAMQANLPDDCINVCNSLLRGEIAAIETYDQAISRFDSHARAADLRRIREEHTETVMALQANVMNMGGIPDTTSGAWGTFAATVQGTANLFGENSAISSLLQGEEFGRGEYEAALSNEHVLPVCRELIGDVLLPRTLRHIEALNALKED